MTDSSSKSTYIFNAEQVDELTRLILQGQALTRAAGGPFGNIDGAMIEQWRNVIDLGCGPGDWVLDVAFAQPGIKVIGVDISKTMIDYAHARTTSQQITNASFNIMDITRPFDFPDASFGDEVDTLYNQMMIDFYAEDFHGVWHYATIQGVKPA